MNACTKKTLLLALSLLTGNTLINAIDVGSKIAQNEVVIRGIKQLQMKVIAKRQKLFAGANGNIFLSRQETAYNWINLAVEIQNAIQHNFPANKLLNHSANTCLSISRQLSNILEAQGEMMPRLSSNKERVNKLRLHIEGDPAERARGILPLPQDLIVIKSKLNTEITSLLQKQNSLNKQINDIKANKGLYWNREKSIEEKELSLSATAKEIAGTELCLELTERTLSAIARMINDFKQLSPEAHSPTK